VRINGKKQIPIVKRNCDTNSGAHVYGGRKPARRLTYARSTIPPISRTNAGVVDAHGSRGRAALAGPARRAVELGALTVVVRPALAQPR
jgi:hypothetical protein